MKADDQGFLQRPKDPMQRLTLRQARVSLVHAGTRYCDDLDEWKAVRVEPQKLAVQDWCGKRLDSLGETAHKVYDVETCRYVGKAIGSQNYSRSSL